MSFSKWQIKVGMVLTPVIPALRRQRQEGFQDFRASLCSTVKNRPAGLQNETVFQKRKTSYLLGMAAYICNPSIQEAKTSEML